MPDPSYPQARMRAAAVRTTSALGDGPASRINVSDQ